MYTFYYLETEKNIPIKSNFDNRSTNKQKLLSYDHMNTANLYHTNLFIHEDNY